MAKKFRMRKEPTKPRRDNFKDEKIELISIKTYCEEPLEKFIDELQDWLDKYPNATIELETDYGACYYEGDVPETVLIVRGIKTQDEFFKEAMAKYNDRLRRYNEWRQQNIEAIRERELKQ
jgi:hypothetical protein